mgnify:FL=1
MGVSEEALCGWGAVVIEYTIRKEGGIVRVL